MAATEPFIYTNSIGTFLFGDDGKIRTPMLFSDVLAANAKLEGGQWTEEEKQLVAQATSKTSILFLGFKKEKPEKVTFTKDIRKLENATQQILEKYGKKVDEAILQFAKQKIRSSVEEDELIAQASSSIQEIEKSVNLLTKRLREWFGLRNPELAASHITGEQFIKKLLENQGRSDLGAQLRSEDIAEIVELARGLQNLITLKERQERYLEHNMKRICPNIAAVVGAALGAKLLASAGSLKRLATLPASTVQLLGAEKSMFNFLRKKSKKMPRFGILHEHTLIARAPERQKGKAARLLADKLSIAARVDYFKGAFVGDALFKEVEARLK